MSRKKHLLSPYMLEDHNILRGSSYMNVTIQKDGKAIKEYPHITYQEMVSKGLWQLNVIGIGIDNDNVAEDAFHVADKGPLFHLYLEDPTYEDTLDTLKKLSLRLERTKLPLIFRRQEIIDALDRSIAVYENFGWKER